MSEKMSIVRWMPPLPKAAEVEESTLVSVRMSEWLVPTEAIEVLQHNSEMLTLLRLCNELEVDRVLHGVALAALQDYLRFKAHQRPSGRVVVTHIK